MTEQTESMIRLICNGKIVGYIRRDAIGERFSKDGKKFDKIPVSSMEVSCASHVYEDLNLDIYIAVNYDSFNLSFKFGDKWVFEGDKVNLKYKDGLIISGTVGYEECFFTIDGAWLPLFPDIKSITVIGNIYENEESHD